MNFLKQDKYTKFRHSKRPKLAFVSNSSWSLYNFRLEVIKHFIDQGFIVYVIASEDEFTKKLSAEGCHFIPVSFNNRTVSFLGNIKLFFELKRIYSHIQPDLIFHYVIKPNIFGAIAASMLGIKSISIITGLGYAFQKNYLLKYLIRYLYTYSLKKVEEVWFLNQQDAEYFLHHKICRESKISILHSEGVDTNKFCSNEREIIKKPSSFIFLMSTRLLWSKGVDLYAKAAKMLKEKGYDVECRIIGFFEEKHPDSIPEQQFSYWRKCGYINYLGFARNVFPFLLEADCFVLPTSYNEGVPRSLLEAASMEIPIITTVNKGCVDVVEDGENGFLCEKNAEDLADKMEKIMFLPTSQRKVMGQNSRKKMISEFDMAHIIDKYAITVSTRLGIELEEKLSLSK